MRRASCFLPVLPVIASALVSPLRAASKITGAHIAAFEKDGVVPIRGLIDLEWLEFLRHEVESAIQNHGPCAEDLAAKGGILPQTGFAGGYFTDLEMADRLPGFRRFACEGPSAAVAARVCSSETARFFYDQLFCKDPADARAAAAFTPWHQDMAYWPVQGEQVGPFPRHQSYLNQFAILTKEHPRTSNKIPGCERLHCP